MNWEDLEPLNPGARYEAIRRLTTRQRLDFARKTLDSGPPPIDRHSDGPIELLGSIPWEMESEKFPAEEAQEAAVLIWDFVTVGLRKLESPGTKSPLWWVPYPVRLVSSASVLRALSERRRTEVPALLMELAREREGERGNPPSR